jgi:5-methylcytosine-specific restriction endonuclease McrA
MRRGYRKGQLTSGRWRKIRDRVVSEEPLCRLRLDCCTIRSTTADHIIPVRYRPDLKYDRRNLRGACGPCNMRRGVRALSAVRAEQRRPRKPAAALEFFS